MQDSKKLTTSEKQFYNLVMKSTDKPILARNKYFIIEFLEENLHIIEHTFNKIIFHDLKHNAKQRVRSKRFAPTLKNIANAHFPDLLEKVENKLQKTRM